jgi:hypothetical protein
MLSAFPRERKNDDTAIGGNVRWDSVLGEDMKDEQFR